MPIFENRRRRAQRRFLAEADRQNHPAALPSPDRAAARSIRRYVVGQSQPQPRRRYFAGFENWAAALKTDGLLFFTHFGRDSLSELTGRLNHEGIECEAPTLIDMHDLGDMLADNGFYDPVTDTAKLELSYKKAGTFWQDMETLGLWNALKFSNPQAAKECVDKIFANEGRLNITLETVYGHAVKKLMLPQGENVVQFFPKRQG